MENWGLLLFDERRFLVNEVKEGLPTCLCLGDVGSCPAVFRL